MSNHESEILQKRPTHKDAKQQMAHKGEHPTDARLRILRDEVLPAVPYILSTVTSLTPEHVKVQYPQNEINWRKYTLFCRGEDELQYVTFKDRSSDRDIRGMYARGGWDDGNGKIAPPEQPYSRTSSDGTPRQGQASKKKKITMADYKNRDRNKVLQSAVAAAVPKPKEVAKDDSKSVIHATNVGGKAESQQIECHGHKRSADTMIGTEDTQPIAVPPTSPPTKKARNAIEVKTASSKTRSEAHQPVSNPGPGPQKPGADGEEKPSQDAGGPNSGPRTSSIKDRSSTPITQTTMSQMSRLPPMLSPLSSEIEEELARMSSAVSDGRPGTAKSHVSLDSSKTSKAEPATTPSVSKGTNPTSAEKLAAIAKLPKSSPSRKGPQEQRHATPGSRQAAKDPAIHNATTPKSAPTSLPNGNKDISTLTPKTTPNAPKRMRLRIMIPIRKKANKKNLATYLRMKPTPGRNSLFPGRPVVVQQDPRPTLSTPVIKSTDKTPHKGDPKISRPGGSRLEMKPDAPKTGDKRGRALMDEVDCKDEPPSKRKVAGKTAHSQKPSTPIAPSTSSPGVSHLGSAQKPPTSTPRAETNGTAMLRAGSGQGSVHTPQAPPVSGTPDTGHRRRRSYTSPDKPVSPVSEDLRAEGSKYMATATILKHDADLFMKKQEEMSIDDRKRGILIGTESVLCFMTAFTLLDTQRNYSDRNAWKSILPYLVILQEAARKGDLKHICGLLAQLEGVIRDQIAYVDMQLLDKDPLKHESSNPSADIPNIRERKAEEYNKRCHELHSHFMKAQTAWRSGWMMLDVIDVQEQYPKTWAKRDERRLAYGKGRDAVFKGKYLRGYNLPMGSMTSGLEAVNFGFNFIAEWSQAVGVEWKPKLVLSE